MHLRGTTAQQVNKSRVEGHDGIPHVDGVILLILQHITAAHKQHQHNDMDRDSSELDLQIIQHIF